MKRFAMCDTSHDFDGDLAVGDAAVAALTNHPADFSFVYFGHTDAVGHDHTWMSDEYLAAIGRADVQVGRVVDALSNGATVIVTADHGGHDRTHGTTMDEDMLVPIVIAGPSVTRARSTSRQVSWTWRRPWRRSSESTRPRNGPGARCWRERMTLGEES